MKTIYINSLDEVFNNEKMSIMLGNFDGFHRGHNSLLEELMKFKTFHALLTFYPHPLSLLKDTNFKILDTVKDKEEYLATKLDYLIVLKTSKTLLNESKERFITFLKNNNCQNIVCGNDFTFGKNREGTIKDLDCFNLKVVPDFTLYNKRVSSTLIRTNLLDGNIRKVTHLLGRYYEIEGIVSKGNQLGRTIGFRTANIEENEYLFPKRGVYFGYAIIDNKKYYGMINVGINPTFNLSKLRIEINIFDFNQDIYNKTIRVGFIKHIRDEVKFNSKEELINELKKNKEECLQYIINM